MRYVPRQIQLVVRYLSPAFPDSVFGRNARGEERLVLYMYVYVICCMLSALLCVRPTRQAAPPHLGRGQGKRNFVREKRMQGFNRGL